MPITGKNFPAIDITTRVQSRLTQKAQKIANELKSKKTNANNSLNLKSKPNHSKPNAEEASKQFEALLLQQMLKSMWQTVPKSDLFGGGQETDLYRGMLNEALSESFSKGEGIGIRDVILKDIKRLEK